MRRVLLVLLLLLRLAAQVQAAPPLWDPADRNPVYAGTIYSDGGPVWFAPCHSRQVWLIESPDVLTNMQDLGGYGGESVFALVRGLLLPGGTATAGGDPYDYAHVLRVTSSLRMDPVRERQCELPLLAGPDWTVYGFAPDWAIELRGTQLKFRPPGQPSAALDLRAAASPPWEQPLEWLAHSGDTTLTVQILPEPAGLVDPQDTWVPARAVVNYNGRELSGWAIPGGSYLPAAAAGQWTAKGARHAGPSNLVLEPDYGATLSGHASPAPLYGTWAEAHENRAVIVTLRVDASARRVLTLSVTADGTLVCNSDKQYVSIKGQPSLTGVPLSRVADADGD
jgi:hypothetical protein